MPTVQVDFFVISLFRVGDPTIHSGTNTEFVPTLATIIRQLEGLTTQFYVWSLTERALLQDQLIHQALVGNEDPTDIRLCIGALSQGASLLQTAFQPTLLSGGLLTFLGHRHRLKSEYQACLARMNLPTEGTASELRAKVVSELDRLQSHTRPSGQSTDQRWFGQVPPVIALKKELEGMLALPIAGYWDLRECADCLLDSSPIRSRPPTDEEAFAAFRRGCDNSEVASLLCDRNTVIYDVLCVSRSLIRQAGKGLLVNSGRRLTTEFMDICRQPYLRKLFFMQQVSVCFAW